MNVKEEGCIDDASGNSLYIFEAFDGMNLIFLCSGIKRNALFLKVYKATSNKVKSIGIETKIDIL